MSDKILNKLQIRSKPKGINFSIAELQMENRELMSELDKRITDILHKIEFEDLNYKNSFRTCQKLQSFLRKKRAIKGDGNIYIPRTESGNYIIKGKVTDKKRREV